MGISTRNFCMTVAVALGLSVSGGAVVAQTADTCKAANQEFQLGFALKTSGNQIQCIVANDTAQWGKQEDGVPTVTLCLAGNEFYSVGALLDVEGRFIKCNTAGTWEAAE